MPIKGAGLVSLLIPGSLERLGAESKVAPGASLIERMEQKSGAPLTDYR